MWEKAGIPTDKHLFPDQFHKMVQSEHEHSSTNSKLIATPAKPSMTTGYKKPFPPTPQNRADRRSWGKRKWSSTAGVHQSTTHISPNPPHPNDLDGVRKRPIAADYSIPRLQNIDPPDSTPAGRLQHFLANWEKLTSDQLVLQIVKGYKIPLKCIPH